MELLGDGLIAFLSAVGLTACVWLAAGAFLGSGKCQNPELLVILPVRGDAPALEADVRDVLRLRRQMPEAAVVLADCGLTEESRDLAEYLCGKYRGIELRDAADVKIT